MVDPVLSVFHPSFAGRVGIARRRLCVPEGIHARSWGRSNEQDLPGTHRPLFATVLSVAGEDSSEPLFLVSLDLGWWRRLSDEWRLRAPLLERLDLDPSRLLICMNHTHSGPTCSVSLEDKPGGDKVAPFLQQLEQSIFEACIEAQDRATPATLAWNTGGCSLAANRDLPDPDSEDAAPARTLCGFNPRTPADDTLLVGRVTDIEGRVIATIVNYACHPTTLGWTNRTQSPDWIGAMREMVETHTEGAPCLFLQGASGELAPREQYVSDPSVADKNGRQVGYAVLSTLEGMLPPGQALRYDAVVESGAALAIWKYATHQAPKRLQSLVVKIPIKIKENLPSQAQLRKRLATDLDSVLTERLERQLHLRESLGDAAWFELPIWVWQLGDSIVVAQLNEAYSDLQTELRQRYPELAIIVVNLANGSCGYLPRDAAYDRETYQVLQTPFARGSLEQLIAACSETIQLVLSRSDHALQPHFHRSAALATESLLPSRQEMNNSSQV